jgi:hypothetical protein
MSHCDEGVGVADAADSVASADGVWRVLTDGESV